ncbi:hypothetical protein BJF88_13870 [Cellulosimicrobium sp. CUA-896]|nr:hypothetical protein BJF88_13870 [Cellulosimicrobium sp. CUA-896]
MLGRTPADPGAVATLRGLYQRARFGRGDVTASDVETARDALDRLATDLSTDRPVRTAAGTARDGAEESGA